ncbi:MAG: HAMP domain-containing protein [Dehalococcoidia bacterium]
MQQYKARPFMKSLRGKIVLMMLVVSLIPLALAGGIMYSGMANTESSANDSVDESRSALKVETVAATKASQAWNISVELETWIAEKIRAVKSWAGNTSIIEAAKYDKDDPSGDAAREVAQTFLGNEEVQDTAIADAYIVNERYKVLAQIPQGKPEINVDAARSAWGPGLYVSELQSTESMAGVPYPYFIDIAALVEDPSEDVPLGVLVVSVRVHPSSLSEEYGMKVPGSELVVWAPVNDNSTHKMIMDTSSDSRYDAASPSLNDAEEEATLLKGPGHEIIYPMREEGGVKRDCIAVTEDWIGGFARASNENASLIYSEFDGLGWLVMVEQDAESALEPISSLDDLESDLNDATNQMLFTLIGVIVGLIIVVPIIAFYLSRGITGPIASLRDAAEKVSMGDMSVSVSIKSDDEIGDLAQSFERMVMAVRFLSQEEEE